MWSAEDYAEAIGAFRREFAGAFRRMLVTRSDTGTWQTRGHTIFDPTKPETREIEVYSGIGFFARPPDGGNGEAVVAQVGGPNNPAIIATRDESTRALVNDLGADEAAAYNSKARVHVTAGGTVDLRTHAAPATDFLLKGTTYRSAETTLIAALNTFVGVLSAQLGTTYPAIATAATVMQTAITTFNAAAATYLSQIGKVG